MRRTATTGRLIAVNGRFLSQTITGVQRYAYEVLGHLDSLLATGQLSGPPLVVFVPPGTRNLPSWSAIQIREVGRLSGQAWEQLDLMFHVRGRLLFTPCGGAPLGHPYHVITIHDTAPFSTPHAYSRRYGVYYRMLHRQLARKAIAVITVSDFSKGEIVRFLKIGEEKIARIYLSGEHILRAAGDDAILQQHNLSPGRFVLAVGSRNPNKNLQGLMQALSYNPLPRDTCLAFAGAMNNKVFSSAPHINTNVRQLGYVGDGALRSLFENAACFVFPSFYEGFGIPPLEALTLGCPVVAARAASLPEVLGAAARYCDPHSPADIAEQISQTLSVGPVSKEPLRKYAGQFSWTKCAEQTWAVLISALRQL